MAHPFTRRDQLEILPLEELQSESNTKANGLKSPLRCGTVPIFENNKISCSYAPLVFVGNIFQHVQVLLV